MKHAQGGTEKLNNANEIQKSLCLLNFPFKV